MGEYVAINGHPTWVDRRDAFGAGAHQPALLLHGGMSHSDLMLELFAAPLADAYDVTAFDRRGHGRTADSDAPFHYDDMAIETIAVLENVVGRPAHLIGWSDGAIVALIVGLRRPELVERLVLIGANFHYDGLLPFEVSPESNLAALMQREYVERSPDGADHFSVVMDKFLVMIATEPTLAPADIAALHAPALVLVGDDDLIKLSHTCSLFEALPLGQLAVVPGASHSVPAEAHAITMAVIRRFLEGEPVPVTDMPVRRPKVQRSSGV